MKSCVKGPRCGSPVGPSPTLASKDTWRAIVEDGVLQGTGMIAWKQYLPAGGAESIRGYVAGQAKVEAAALAANTQ